MATPFRNTLNTLKKLEGKYYYSLLALEEGGKAKVSRLPVSIRIMLESLLRHCDGKRVKEEDVLRLAHWQGGGDTGEVPFVVSRVLLQDFTGVPLIVDLAAMRDMVAEKGRDPSMIEPLVPVDLVVDHSVQVDRAATSDAYAFNLKIEFQRNKERYEFLKWGEQAFETFKVVPPGIGICHQANLEYLALVVAEKSVDGEVVLYPDTLVGTDSHTTMINGLGVVGWGVGGIEAQAAMLGQSVTLQMPEVIGVLFTGALREGVTATDLTLRVTEMLRKENVVDKFVEFFGEGVESLTVADRATIANMSPEYGATMGFFPVDEKTCAYLRMTGRDEEKIAQVKAYLKAQGLFGIPKKGEIDFSKVLELDLSTIPPSVAGPKRPQDRLALSELKEKFEKILQTSTAEDGYGKTSPERIYIHSNGEFSPNIPHPSGGTERSRPGAPLYEAEMVLNRPFTHADTGPGYPSRAHPCDDFLTHGSVVIAAITSCTNTSNPSVMFAAGLLAKKAVERGLRVSPMTKTSLAPGSRVVTDYLEKAGLQKYLDELGFQLVGYGCTTCIGNSGPLDEKIEKAIKTYDLITASVLSGNRNFEARIHSSVKANFLMSPPLVVAFALAGRVDIDMEKEPLGHDKEGKAVFLKEIWPTSAEIEKAIGEHLHSEMFKKRYSRIDEDATLWKKIDVNQGKQYQWDPSSTYIQKPPYFEGFAEKALSLENMRCLALLGDSVTTDHISPAGAIREDTPAGQYLLSLGVKKEDFNSYGSRRGNHQVMMRGTFANVRLKNLMLDGKEGGFTYLLPEGSTMPIFDACQLYAQKKTPLIVIAGRDYGMGSSRDWAAKGALLLGVKAVLACNFERIHRSNLIGMGILPLEFKNGDTSQSLQIKGDELFSLHLPSTLSPNQEAHLDIINEHKRTIPVTIRFNSPLEIDYYQSGGIMPYVLREKLS